MKARVINLSDTNEEARGVLRVRKYINSSELRSLSLDVITIDGENNLTKNKSFDAIYYVLEGDGDFLIEDKEYHVKKDDLIIIPRNTTYQERGDMKLLSVCSPRWKDEG